MRAATQATSMTIRSRIHIELIVPSLLIEHCSSKVLLGLGVVGFLLG